MLHNERIHHYTRLKCLLFDGSGARVHGLRVLPLPAKNERENEWGKLGYLHDFGAVVLHLHDYVLRLLICVDSLVEDLNNTNRGQLARMIVGKF